MICSESGLMALVGIGVLAGSTVPALYYCTPVIGFFTSTAENAVQFVLRGQRQHAERLQRLAEALVVEEVEELVLEDRAAEVDAVLVAVEGRLLERSGDAVPPTSVGLKKPAAFRSVLRMNS